MSLNNFTRAKQTGCYVTTVYGLIQTWKNWSNTRIWYFNQWV